MRSATLRIGGALALLQLAALPAVAQFSFGFSLGPNLTSVNVDWANFDATDYKPTVGFYLSADASLAAKFAAVRASATFVNAGALFNGTTFLDQDEFDINYLTVPVDLVLRAPLGDSFMPYVFGGPEFRYLVDVKDTDPGFADHFESLSTAATIGAGVALSVPMLGRFAPEVRYSIDLQGILDGDITVGDEVVRVREAFKADMLRFGLMLSF